MSEITTRVRIAPLPALDEVVPGLWEGWTAPPRAWSFRIATRSSGKTKKATIGVAMSGARPTLVQARAYDTWRGGGAALRDAVLDRIAPIALAHGIPRARLRRHVELATVVLREEVARRSAFLGLHLRCTWDPEHGVGVFLHGRRIVAVGCDVHQDRPRARRS